MLQSGKSEIPFSRTARASPCMAWSRKERETLASVLIPEDNQDDVDHVRVVTEPVGVLPVQSHQSGPGNGTDPGRPGKEHLGHPKQRGKG